MLSIVRSTAKEVLSEPLTLLVLLSAQALAILTPLMHIHQFGDIERMSRDAGFSALLMGGVIFAVYGAVHTWRKEIESRTIDMALVSSVSRGEFFIGKLLGVWLATLGFLAVGLVLMMIMVNGFIIGGEIAAKSGEVAVIYGPALIMALSLWILPLMIGAFLNHYCRARFVFSVFRTAFILAALLALPSIWFDLHGFLAYAGAWTLLMPFVLFFGALASALAVRFRAGAVGGMVTVVFLLSLPALGNYHLPEMLKSGGTIGGAYIVSAIAWLLPALAAVILLGIKYMRRFE